MFYKKLIHNKSLSQLVSFPQPWASSINLPLKAKREQTKFKKNNSISYDF